MGKTAWWGCEIWDSYDSINIRVFCDMASCSLVDVYKCFRGLDLLLRLAFWFSDDESLGMVTTEFLYQLVFDCSGEAFHHVPGCAVN